MKLQLLTTAKPQWLKKIQFFLDHTQYLSVGGGSWNYLLIFVTQRSRLMEKFHLEFSQREIELQRVPIHKSIHNSLVRTSHMVSPNQNETRKCSFTICLEESRRGRKGKWTDQGPQYWNNGIEAKYFTTNPSSTQEDDLQSVYPES